MADDKKEEPKKEESKPKVDASSVAASLKAIDEKYKAARKKRNEELYVKNKIQDNAGTQSRTKIAGLRGLEPRLGQQFVKK